MSVTFSANAIYQRKARQINQAVSDTVRIVTEDARRRAPVRKVFKGSLGRATLQSIEEAAAEVALRSRLGLAPGPVRTQRTPAARVHGFGPRRLLTSPRLPAYDVGASRFRAASGRFTTASAFRATQPLHGQLQFATELSARGRYELKTGRANITAGGKTYLGGRLRSQITSGGVSGNPVFVGSVISPTPYAKYVEFGTRHNRAQPYLRPALAAQREAFRKRLQRAVG